MEERERFAALVARPEATIELDELAWSIAANARPGLDPDVERARLDALASGCPEATLEGLRAHLFAELGFTGDRLDYHDPRNSYLDEVVTRRLGIPISLSVLAVAVGRRLGVPLVGVGMPGHFLVADGRDADVFLDPFHHGSLLDTAGCERLFHSLHGAATPFHPSYLQPVGAHAIASRMLANLRTTFASRGDTANLLWVLRLRVLVPGERTVEHRELASALVAAGDFRGAAEVLDALAVAAPDHAAAAQLTARAEHVRSRLN
ncbi:MAG: transglutaminase-like domain-containing protein [Acidimicrobiales bacterium]|nr:transglutaminase-like domain-containing protein [Acidimicrobiales bacterium]